MVQLPSRNAYEKGVIHRRFAMGGAVALIIMLLVILYEKLHDKLTPAIPAENWANKKLIEQDRMSGMSEKEILRNVQNGRYYIPKEVFQAYPVPHREPDGQHRLLIENCELHKDDVRQYGSLQAKKWLEQGKYNLNAEELEITDLQYELRHLSLMTLISSNNCGEEKARMEEIKQILATKNWDYRNTEALKQWQAAHDAEMKYTEPGFYVERRINKEKATIESSKQGVDARDEQCSREKAEQEKALKDTSPTSQSPHFLQKYKGAVIGTLCFIAVCAWLVTAPQTVASGNGYSHQIGSFGECDVNFDGCTISATHRRHHFWENEDYCESCWNGYGQDMFNRLSETKSESGGIKYDEYKCRCFGCEKEAVYSDWTRRYCAEHIKGTHYCRYPGCLNEITNYSTDLYCNEH